MHMVLGGDDHGLCRATNKSEFQKPARFLMSGEGFVRLSLRCFMWLILHLKSRSVPTIVFFNSRIQGAGNELWFPCYCYCYLLFVYWSEEISASQGICFMWTKILWLKTSNADRLQEHMNLNLLLNRRRVKRKIKKKKSPQNPKKTRTILSGRVTEMLSCTSVKIDFFHWITSSPCI